MVGPSPMPLFLNMDHLVNGKDNTASNFTHRQRCAHYLSNDAKHVGVSQRNSCHWVVFHSVALLRLCVVLTDTYNIKVLCSWYRSIDVDCILFHVNFEGGLSMSVLRNRATSWSSKPMSFQKSCNFKNFHHPPARGDSHLHTYIVSADYLYPALCFTQASLANTYYSPSSTHYDYM
jgi:hypothetical protein